MVGVVAGAVVAVLLLLLLGLYIYFFLVRRRRLRSSPGSAGKRSSAGVNVDIVQQVHTAGSDHTDASSYDDVKNSSSNHLVAPPQISTISGAYKQHLAAAVNGGPQLQQQPTSFGQGLTPTYWSASQLLKGKRCFSFTI